MTTVQKIKIIIFFIISFDLYAQDLFWKEVKTSIQKNDYQKSYDLLKGVNLNQAVINHQILYDLSAVKLKKNDTLLCLKGLKAFPQSETQVYTMSLCSLLNLKKRGEKIRPEKIKNFENLLKQYPKEHYLLEVVKNL